MGQKSVVLLDAITSADCNIQQQCNIHVRPSWGYPSIIRVLKARIYAFSVFYEVPVLNYSSYKEAANAARALAKETQQSVKVIRDQGGWVISTSGKNTSTEQAKPDDLEAIFSRKKGDYDTDYDTDPPFWKYI